MTLPADDNDDKVCEEIAVVCDLSEPPSEKAMSRRLRALGLTARGGGGGGKVGRKAALAHAYGGSSRSKVPPGLLKQLFEEFRGHPDALNQVCGGKCVGHPDALNQV